MKKRGKIKSIIITILLIVLALTPFVVTQILFNSSDEGNKVKVSNEIIEEKIIQIDEWATTEFDYTGEFKKSKPRKLFGLEVPLTDNNVFIEYQGVIKVGYVMKEAKIECDDTNKKITIKLPEPKVFDNYIILDTMKIKEENNILNPLHVSDLPEYFDSIKADELEKAEDKQNIYVEAEKNAKKIIENVLAVFEYEVIFK